MRLYSTKLFLLFLTLETTVCARRRLHVEHEARDLNEDASVKLERVESQLLLPIRIGLTQSNLEHGHAELMAISDPGSPRFGKHYTAQEVEKLFAPSSDTISTVRAWIKQTIHGNKISVSSNRQWIHFNATANELEALLDTELFYYEHSAQDHVTVGCDRYHVPLEIQHHIDYITPGVKRLHVGSKAALKRRSSDPRRISRPNHRPLSPQEQSHADQLPFNCEGILIPECIKQLYQINDKIRKTAGSSVATFNSAAQYYYPPDLQEFFQVFTDIDPDQRPTEFSVDGGMNPNSTKLQPYGGEANLDLQALFPLAFPHAEVQYYQVDDIVYNKHMYFHPSRPFGFNTFLEALDGSYCNYSAFGIKGDSKGYDAKYPDPSNKPGSYKGKLQCGKFALPKIISISYGAGELFYPMNYQRRQCNEFMKLGMQGVSVISSSGDQGVESNTGPPYCLGKKHKTFGANTPVNCPYITSVGGTATDDKGKVRSAIYYPSGGGFSNIYPRPAYQDKAVSEYLEKHTPPYQSYNTSYNPMAQNVTGIFNRAGRGYPDVSAVGDNYLGIYGGKRVIWSGTSLSTPLFAGVISRINSHRIASGKGPLGFLNPVLYSHPEMFDDVIEGDNVGCGTRGFSCAPGWDPVTGLGTPNYPKMKKVLLALP